eukprot:SAG31_NODE_177_length_21310_cov_8.894064_5_plen_56_part_00
MFGSQIPGVSVRDTVHQHIWRQMVLVLCSALVSAEKIPGPGGMPAAILDPGLLSL